MIHEKKERDVVWIKLRCRTVHVCMEKNIVQIFAVLQKVLITPIILLLSPDTQKTHVEVIIFSILFPIY